jgi:hypothetical protein
MTPVTKTISMQIIMLIVFFLCIMTALALPDPDIGDAFEDSSKAGFDFLLLHYLILFYGF